MTIRVLVVDDQGMVRAGFCALLEAQNGIEVAGQAANGVQAVELAEELQPDVVLMDVRMPEMNGLEAARRILDPSRAQHPRVVMLTTFDVDEYVYEALRIGASGFLLKDTALGDLGGAVRTVVAGESLLAPSVTRRLIKEFVGARWNVSVRSDRLAALTAREQEVLELIARGLSNAEIAEQLVVSEQTVKTHVGNIFAKIDARDRAQAVVFAYETGLVSPS